MARFVPDQCIGRGDMDNWIIEKLHGLFFPSGHGAIINDDGIAPQATGLVSAFRYVYRCMAWAGTGMLWTAGGRRPLVVPRQVRAGWNRPGGQGLELRPDQ